MNRGLVNKETLFQNRPISQRNQKIASKKNLRNGTMTESRQKPTLSDRFRCWKCGLYQGDVEICSGCNYSNS